MKRLFFYSRPAKPKGEAGWHTRCPKAPRTLAFGEGYTKEELGPIGPRERWSTPEMPTDLERLVQLVCSTKRGDESCPRALCRRYRYCVPPRLPDDRNLFRCPLDSHDLWPRRHAVAKMLAERLVKAAEAGYAARAVPSPFAPEPALDHLDLTRAFDADALLATEKEAYEEWKRAGAGRSY